MERAGKGRGKGRAQEGKREQESKRIRERGGASSPFYSGSDLPGCCQVTVGRGIPGCCQVIVGWNLDRILTHWLISASVIKQHHPDNLWKKDLVLT